MKQVSYFLCQSSAAMSLLHDDVYASLYNTCTPCTSTVTLLCVSAIGCINNEAQRERGGERSWVLHPSRETYSSMAGVQLLRCDVSVSRHHISSMTLCTDSWTDAVHATQLATNQSVGKYQGTQRRDATKPLDAHCCHMGTVVVFDTRALWRLGLIVRVPRCQKLQMTA